MNETTDAELLARFAESESEEAFTALVNRHLQLVHSVALRHTTNPHHAEEITQAVFIILARKVRSLGCKTILSGWLYHTARLTAANFQRGELRRARREQEAFMQSTIEQPSSETVWHELHPLLDEAMARLGPTDRDAVVLRYFENKSLQEVGQTLGVEERAAQKRVSRALEKLRRIFTKHGVISTATIIAGAISANSVQAAPTALAPTITAAVFKGSAVAGSTLALVKGTLHIMSWMKAKTAAIIGASALLVVGASVALAHHNWSQGALVSGVHHIARHLVALTHHNWSQRAQPQAEALSDKLQAEREGGPANVAQDASAQKSRDEQKALR
ncbi:MAG: sigma-70 family RNA polymerase sigma factor [Verrucomicrobiota bacterium]